MSVNTFDAVNTKQKFVSAILLSFNALMKNVESTVNGNNGNKVPALIAVIVTAIAIFSAWNPPSGAFWFVEASWPIGAALVLALTFRRFRFSDTAYVIIALWVIMHLIGARYTFENVPGFESLGESLGLSGRNHFDRIAHFVIGINSFLFAELILRRKWVAACGIAALGGWIAITAMAGVWEIIEWLYAAWDGGDAGAAFLGSQGDIWDAQKDILCDMLGAVLGSAIFYLKNRAMQSPESAS